MKTEGGYPPEIFDALTAHLTKFASERRLKVLSQAISYRTKYLTVILEDIYQSQNASAVLRTCECYGVQDVHIIENRNEFTLSPQVVMGASKWLSVSKYNKSGSNTLEAINTLRSKGYRIVATSPHAKQDLYTFDANKGKFALMFGTELNGLTNIALDNADEEVRIPMVGLTESLNLSVTAAICIYALLERLRNSETNIALTQQEKKILLHQWLRKSIKDCKSIEKRFIEANYPQKSIK